MKAKRILALLMAVIMLSGLLAGCKSEDTKTNTSQKDQPTTAVTNTPAPDSSDSGAKEEENTYTEKITFTMSAVGADKAGIGPDGSSEPAANFKWLCDKFNIEFDFWPLTWSNYIDQTRLWLNADSAPDIIMLDVAASRYSEYLDWVDAGLFRPYDVTQYENLTSNFNNMVAGKKFEVDGKLYAWPSYTDMGGFKSMMAPGFVYRKDWAKAVGLYKEGDVYSYDEWWNLVDAVIKENPGNNSQGNTIGVIGSDWTFPRFFTGQVSPYMVSFKKNSDGSWVWGPTLPESLAAVKAAKDLYDKGLIWRDQPMVTSDDLKNNFTSGRLFAAANSAPGVSAILADYAKPLADVFPELNVEDAIGYALVKGPDGKLVGYQQAEIWSQTAMNAKISDEKAERWQAVLDFLNSKDGRNFRNYGIQGVDWEYGADGEVVDHWKVEDGNKVAPFPNDTTWQWTRPGGNNDGFAMFSPGNPEWIRNIATSTYDTYTKQGLIVPFDANFAYFYSEAYANATAGLEKAIYTKIAELMTSNNIEADWTAWVNQKLKEVQPAIDELNANLK